MAQRWGMAHRWRPERARERRMAQRCRVRGGEDEAI